MVKGNRNLKQHARELQSKYGLPYMQAREEALAQDTPIAIGSAAGVEMQVVIEGGMGDLHPYRASDNPVLAQIQLQDGTVVLSCDYGGRGTFTFSGGEQATSWVHPMLDVNDRDTAAHLITREQFAALERADAFALSFFVDDLDVDGKRAREMTSTQVVSMVKGAVQALGGEITL